MKIDMDGLKKCTKYRFFNTNKNIYSNLIRPVYVLFINYVECSFHPPPTIWDPFKEA